MLPLPNMRVYSPGSCDAVRIGVGASAFAWNMLGRSPGRFDKSGSRSILGLLDGLLNP
jgi:hypothetical protein